MVPAVLAVLLAPSAARGEQGRGTIAIIPLSSSQAQRAVSEALASKIEPLLTQYTVLSATKTRQKMLKQGGQSALRRAARTAASARRSLEAFDDLPATARQLEEAADAHLDLLPLLRTLDEPVGLFVDLATVELARGQQDQVAKALEAASRLDPTFDLDPQEVSPTLARAARDARAKVSDRPILTEERARRLGKVLGVDALLLVQPRPGPQQLLVEQYQSSSGNRTKAWTVRDDDLAALAADFGAPPPTAGWSDQPAGGDDVNVNLTEGEEAVVFGTPETQEPPRQRPRRAWYRRWWVWTLIGVAVAGGAAAGIYFGVTSQASPNDLTLQVNSHWNQ